MPAPAPVLNMQLRHCLLKGQAVYVECPGITCRIDPPQSPGLVHATIVGNFAAAERTVAIVKHHRTRWLRMIERCIGLGGHRMTLTALA